MTESTRCTNPLSKRMSEDAAKAVLDGKLPGIDWRYVYALILARGARELKVGLHPHLVVERFDVDVGRLSENGRIQEFVRKPRTINDLDFRRPARGLPDRRRTARGVPGLDLVRQGPALAVREA